VAGQNLVAEDAAAYRVIGWLLLAGLLVAIGVMALGLVVAGVEGKSVVHVLTLDREIPQLVKGDPAAILDGGILLLFATPLVGVVAAFASFIAARNVFFSWTTGALLVMLTIAFAVALR
jgi:uncharacterized membrane protein